MSRILIIDDHRVLADMVARELVDRGHTPEVHDLIDLDAFPDNMPDLVLLDLELGEGRPIGLRYIDPFMTAGAPVLVMTGTTSDLVIAEALAEGASGVFVKAGGIEELMDAVERGLSGEQLPPSDAERVRLSQVREAERRRVDKLRAPFLSLSRTEGVVLGQLARGQTVSEIASKSFTAESTVRSHVKAIRRKLGVANQLQAVARMHEADWEPPSGGA